MKINEHGDHSIKPFPGGYGLIKKHPTKSNQKSI